MKNILTLLAITFCLNGRAQCNVTQTGYTEPTCAGQCNGTTSFNIPAAVCSGSDTIFLHWSPSSLTCATLFGPLRDTFFTPANTPTTYSVVGLCACLDAYVVFFTNNPTTQDSTYAQFAIHMANPPPPVISSVTQTSHTLCVGASDTIKVHHTTASGIAPVTYTFSPSSGLNVATDTFPSCTSTSSCSIISVIATPTTTTHYTITISDANGCMGAADTLSVIVENCSASITKLASSNATLANPHPNPTNSTTTIEYSLPQGTNQAELVFYSVQGTEVKRFKVDNTFSSLLISTTDIAAGTYYYNLQVGGNASGSKKMVVVK